MESKTVSRPRISSVDRATAGASTKRMASPTSSSASALSATISSSSFHKVDGMTDLTDKESSLAGSVVNAIGSIGTAVHRALTPNRSTLSSPTPLQPHVYDRTVTDQAWQLGSGSPEGAPEGPSPDIPKAAATRGNYEARKLGGAAVTAAGPTFVTPRNPQNFLFKKGEEGSYPNTPDFHENSRSRSLVATHRPGDVSTVEDMRVELLRLQTQLIRQ